MLGGRRERDGRIECSFPCPVCISVFKSSNNNNNSNHDHYIIEGGVVLPILFWRFINTWTFHLLRVGPSYGNDFVVVNTWILS